MDLKLFALLKRAINLESYKTSNTFANIKNVLTILRGDETVEGSIQNSIKKSIDDVLSRTYKPAGSLLFADLPELTEDIIGNVYDIKDEFTTDERFLSGSGNLVQAGTNVAVVKRDGTLLFDALSGMINFSEYEKKVDASAKLAESKAYSDGNLQTAKDYSDENLATAKNHSDTNLQIAKDYSDNNLAIAKDYSDEQDAINLQSAKDYADEKDATNLQTAKDYSDDNLQKAKDYADQETLVSAKAYADEKDEIVLSTAKGYTDTQDASYLESAKNYSDDNLDTAKDYSDNNLEKAKTYSDTVTLQSAKDYANGQDEVTLQSAKDYADEKDATNLQTAKDYSDNNLQTATTHSNNNLETAKIYSDTNLQIAKDYSDANLQTAKEHSDTNLQTAKSYTDTAKQDLQQTIETTATELSDYTDTKVSELETNLGNELIATIKTELLLAAHPIGSLYWSSNSTNPSELFGGTWTQIKDKFILAAGDTYTVNATGGAATVILTADQLPNHRHYMEHKHTFTPSGSVSSHTHGMSHTHSVTASGSISGGSYTFTGTEHTHTLTPSGTITVKTNPTFTGTEHSHTFTPSGTLSTPTTTQTGTASATTTSYNTSFQPGHKHTPSIYINNNGNPDGQTDSTSGTCYFYGNKSTRIGDRVQKFYGLTTSTKTIEYSKSDIGDSWEDEAWDFNMTTKDWNDADMQAQVITGFAGAHIHTYTLPSHYHKFTGTSQTIKATQGGTISGGAYTFSGSSGTTSKITAGGTISIKTNPSFTGTAVTSGGASKTSTDNATPTFSGTTQFTSGAWQSTLTSVAGSEKDRRDYTDTVGSGAAINKMPPYIVKYCWERTA